MAFCHGRVLTATYLLPRSRHRRDDQRELRRRVDCAHHRAVRVWHLSRIDVARRPAGAAATETQHGCRATRRVRRRRSPWSRPESAAWRCVAGQADRAIPSCRFTWKRPATGASRAGIGRRFHCRSPQSRSRSERPSRCRRRDEAGSKRSASEVERAASVGTTCRGDARAGMTR